jgi:hypothetical protein
LLLSCIALFNEFLIPHVVLKPLTQAFDFSQATTVREIGDIGLLRNQECFDRSSRSVGANNRLISGRQTVTSC